MQEIDAERRIQILRGLPVEVHSTPVEKEQVSQSRENRPDRERKRRRIAGEDDTDRDIRYALENNAIAPAKAEIQMKSKKSSDAPITDVNGHINLFPMEGTRHNAPKNVEVEAEKAKKQKDFEDQYTMRFSNAAGFKQAIGERPWYHRTSATGGGDGEEEVEAPSKDVWGNEDPRRKEREKMRTINDDPLAAIQKGVAGVREVEHERKKWKEEKDREIRELEEAEKRRDRKRRKRREADDLENFNLDDSGKTNDRAWRHRHHHRSRDDSSTHSHQRRSRSPNYSRHRSHHHRHRPVVVDNRTGWEVGPGGRYSSQFAQ